MHPDLQVHDYALLIDSITWELDFLTKSGWEKSLRFERLLDIQNRIQSFIDNAPPF